MLADAHLTSAPEVGADSLDSAQLFDTSPLIAARLTQAETVHDPVQRRRTTDAGTSSEGFTTSS